MIKNNKIRLGIIIDTDLRLPPFTGVTYRLYYLSKQLVNLGLSVKIFLCNRNIKNSQDIKALYDKSGIEFHVLPEFIFYSVDKMLEIVKIENINILQFEDSVSVLRYKKIFNKINLPVCLEMHDVESSLKEMLNYCPKDVKNTLKISALACKYATKIICMTPFDRNELITKIGVENKKISIIPNPIDLRKFRYLGPINRQYNVVFIGNMFYKPNANAVKMIIKKIIPNVHKKNPKTNFYFIGIAPKGLMKMKSNKIIFTGKVVDLNYFLKNASISLCPVYEGSGMKVKLLNYCAAGIPVISTSIGASGYEKVKSLIVEDKIENYSTIINKLLNDNNKLINIGKKNRKYIEEYFDIEKLSVKIIEIYKQILNKKQISNKKFYKIKNISPLFWLSEKRVNKINNNYYYIIKNGKTVFKKKCA